MTAGRQRQAAAAAEYQVQTVSTAISGIIQTKSVHRHALVAIDRAVFKGGGGYGFKPLKIMTKKLICPSVSVFHISVQWSFNVDLFIQTFDS